ncbi:unnamed protein product [Vitrella brassicaformis CCMP3155]|uniref:Uncharacterized protein n=1 Tax=Vitrella brassicaformis (strain CCMP3155) TaxID=1169540 RepID=A0A0G4F3S8_VITBC|nr:unnamed protein product [Vitrella brassicaformis CCMP3155]|mmetsp:Transcript_3137/g.7118  ORF Transcript_3137/g.7118 Transcript_3137/m.7118 type:complete len:125 (-) Transcript_3137:107-481(-)|eukprot:CEM06357.1 unnamed protein product [Vitrella brassicaformis CCMP3155]
MKEAVFLAISLSLLICGILCYVWLAHFRCRMRRKHRRPRHYSDDTDVVELERDFTSAYTLDSHPVGPSGVKLPWFMPVFLSQWLADHGGYAYGPVATLDESDGSESDDGQGDGGGADGRTYGAL